MTTPTDTALENLDRALSALNGEPCNYVTRGLETVPCLAAPRPGEGASFADMNPARMCNGCAAYWHASTAVNTLLRARRLAREVAATGD